MEAIFSSLKSWVVNVIAMLLNLLPDSPFHFESAGEFRSIMGYINYFVPVGAMLSILSTWLVAVGAYYVVSAVLRWVKAIE